MNKIECKTSNCEHNLKCRCLAGVIAVGETAKCLSRVKRDGGSLAQSFADVEAGEDVFSNGNMDCVVQCSASCAFNSGGVCSCESIDVDDTFVATKCKTRVSPRE